MSKESLEHLRDYIQLTLSPMDIHWLMNELSAKLHQQETLKPYTMDEINTMIDEGERQIANGEYYTTEQVIDMLAEELELSDEEYSAASKQSQRHHLTSSSTMLAMIPLRLPPSGIRDVATALGYSNTRDALNRHVDKEDRDGVVIHDSIGRHQARFHPHTHAPATRCRRPRCRPQ